EWQPSAGTSAATNRLFLKLLWAARRSSFLNSRHARQNVEHHREVQLLPAHAARGGQKLVADGGGGNRNIQLASEFHSQEHVLLHHVAVKPSFFRLLQNERTAIDNHRRSNRTVNHSVHGHFACNSALLRQQYSFA